MIYNVLRKHGIPPKTSDGLYTISKSYSIDKIRIVVQNEFASVPSTSAFRNFIVYNLVHRMNVVEGKTKLLLYLQKKELNPDLRAREKTHSRNTKKLV